LNHSLRRAQAHRYRRIGLSRGPLELIGVLLGGVKIRLTLTVLLVLVTLGTLGYMTIEGWKPVDSFYMTIITLTTVGYGEVKTLSSLGRMFTVLLILSGVSILAYGLSGAVESVVSGQVFKELTERRKRKMLDALNNHYIVAGFGRVGREVAQVFADENVPFVVVDPDLAAVEAAKAQGYLAIVGSSTEDAALLEAGIQRARGLVAAAGNDATNIYAVLSARSLNEKLFIIVRANDQASERKMLRAGADRVISPYALSGRRMANLAIRPHVVDFIDVTSRSSSVQQWLEEVEIEAGSLMANQTIGQIDLRRRNGATIVALYSADGKLLSNPTAASMLEPASRLILLGTREQLDATEALARNLNRLAQAEER
jgi:voltage-gated potassium channel